ncbi:MAG TPA: DUF1786 family protein, partial [Ktedonobacterales bacterium]|nr:DUF1786 family protein [Ktedonobacterales bacterium]
MRVLAVDVGTGTQDILLFESDRTIENCYQLILPSPTVMVAERIRRATRAGAGLLLTGRTMGGGPSAWAARDHALAGLSAYATADAARTLDDDLSAVEALGFQVVDDQTASQLIADAAGAIAHVELRDFDAGALRATLATFGIEPTVDVVAVAAFDHGAAPPGYSDRRFRFDYIRRAVAARPEPIAFAYRAADLPTDLTRLAAVAADASDYQPRAAHSSTPPPAVVVMDTGSAAVAGAMDDSRVRAADEVVIANVGNFHTLAFHLLHGRIEGLFEHHTGELTRPKLERYLSQLVDGSISDDAVFADSGHGALLRDTRLEARPDGPRRSTMPLLAVTGPRRDLLRGSLLAPYEAVPHGDMMLAGCF